jgi:hypothetical protein
MDAPEPRVRDGEQQRQDLCVAGRWACLRPSIADSRIGGSDIRRTSFLEQINGTEASGSWRVHSRHPDRTAGTTGLRQPPTPPTPGGPAMITLAGHGRLTRDVQTRTTHSNHHLGRQRPPRPRRPVRLRRPDRLGGAGQGRRRPPRQGPGRQLLRALRAARVHDERRRKPDRARAARRRHRIRAQAPQRRARRAGERGRALRGRHSVLTASGGRVAGTPARPATPHQPASSMPSARSARADGRDATAVPDSSAVRVPSSTPLRGSLRSALSGCA